MSDTLEVLARHGVEIALALSLVLAIGALAVRCSRSPVLRHRFTEWTLGLALLAVPLLILPLPRLRSRAAPRIEARTAVQPESPAPLAREETSAATVVSELPATAAVPLIWPIVPSEIVFEEVPLPTTAASTSTAKWLSLGFLLGAVGFALHLLLSLWCLRRSVRRARPAPTWVLELAPAPDRTRILVSTETERPFCFGFSRGTILLPESLVESRQRRRLRVVLLHERAHLEQRHGRTRLIAALAAPLFYWQPLYWWLARASRQDAELVADDLAAGSMNKRDYAAELLGLVESTDRVGLVAATGLGTLGSRQDFLERMETLLMRRTPLSIRESRLQFAGRTAFALTLLATVTLAWGHTPQDGDPTEESAVPFLADIPLLGSLFQNAEEPQEDEQPDPGPLAGEFDIAFTFGQLTDLLDLQRRCAVEGGQIVITALWDPEPGAETIKGRCRVFDLTVEGKYRFLRRPPESKSPYPDHNPRRTIIMFRPGLWRVQTPPPELASVLSEKQLENIRVWTAQGPPPELASIRSEIHNLERRLVQLEHERIDIENALASKRQRRDLLMGEDRTGPGARSAEPAIRGSVLNVASSSNGQLVTIDRGSNQGVEIGTIFEIHREATYKGRVEVIQVQGDICAGKVLLAPWPMSQGDQATTKL